MGNVLAIDKEMKEEELVTFFARVKIATAVIFYGLVNRLRLGPS